MRTLRQTHTSLGTPSGNPLSTAAIDWHNLPLFPLGTVLFPGGVLPLRVFEARYVDMMRERMKAEQPFGVCLIKDGAEVGGPAVPFEIGCLASIVDFDMLQPGILNIRTHGGARFRVLETRNEADGLVRANTEAVSDDAKLPLPAEFSQCAQMLRAILPKLPGGLVRTPHQFDDAAWVSNRLAEILPIQALAKQRLMALTAPLMRLEIIHKYLTQQGLNNSQA